MRGWKGLAAAWAATCFLVEPLQAAPNVIIADEDPNTSDWSVELLLNNSGVLLPDPSLEDFEAGGDAEGPYVLGRFGVAARPCEPDEPPDGVDGLCYGRSIHTVFFAGSSYRPGRDGAVSGLTANVHVKASAPAPAGTVPHGHPSGASVYLAFRQDGVTYWRRPPLVTDVWTPGEDPEGDWNAGGAEIALDDDFVHSDESGVVVDGGPNFVDGGALEVGLLFSATSQFGAHPNAIFRDLHGQVIEREFAFDDFEVVLQRADVDADGYDDEVDNCVEVANGSETSPQCDTDRDGYGNACDGDFDQNLVTTASDFIPYQSDSKPPEPDSGVGTDMNCDGSVDAIDFLSYFLPNYELLGRPGPSGLACAGTVPCER